MVQELADRFDHQQVLPPALVLGSPIIKAANGELYDDTLLCVENSCYTKDFDFAVLRRHLCLPTDMVYEKLVCDAMNSN